MERRRKIHLCRGESGVEGHNSENVDEEDNHARNCNRAGKIPHWVLGKSLMKKFLIFPPHLHLLNDEVEVVPAGVGEEARVEGQGDEGGVGHCVFPGEVLCSPVPQLDKPETNQLLNLNLREVQNRDVSKCQDADSTL